jgi:hypothetical protein
VSVFTPDAPAGLEISGNTALVSERSSSAGYDWTPASSAHPYSQTLAVAIPDVAAPPIAPDDSAPIEDHHAGQPSETLRVQSVVVTGAGVHVRFNQLFDVSALAGNGADSAVSLMRGTLPLKGRFVVDADGKGFVVIVSGTGIRSGDYRIHLRSGAFGFAKPTGEPLDGDADGHAGGDYRGHLKLMLPTTTDPGGVQLPNSSNGVSDLRIFALIVPIAVPAPRQQRNRKVDVGARPKREI